MNTRLRSDSRSENPAMINARLIAQPAARDSLTARSSPAHHLEVGVLQRGADDADLVDVLARLDQLAHDPRDLVAAGLREVAHAAPGLDLHTARLRELRGRARRHHFTARDHD